MGKGFMILALVTGSVESRFAGFEMASTERCATGKRIRYKVFKPTQKKLPLIACEGYYT
jgi:hypothetical protein